MRHPDLAPLTQAVLLTCMVILTGLVLFRVTVFFRRQFAGIPHRYPVSWTTDQANRFERFRMFIGVALVLTWAALQFAAPSMPVSWPFGLEETLEKIGLLLLTNAWLLLLIPTDWERTILGKLRFATTFGVLALWWIALLGAVLVTIVLATSRPVQLNLPMGLNVALQSPAIDSAGWFLTR